MTTITSVRPAVSATPQQPTTQSHPYTCNSCQVAFRTSDLQRTHMRSDWHRYNLKRRVASLPPLNSEIFAEKVLNAQATTSAAAAKASFETLCEVCQKKFYSENAFQNHLASQKHLANVKGGKRSSVGKDDDEMESVVSSTISLGPPVSKDAPASAQRVDQHAAEQIEEIVDGIKTSAIEDEEDRTVYPISPLPHNPIATVKPTDGADNPATVDLTHCLFCPVTSPDLPSNLTHMSLTHGTFIPEQPYLTSLEGLLTYLHKKITENNECLYCHKLRSSTEGIQTHMRDKGHCMIGFTTEEEMLEVGEFYDFRGTYSDDDEEDDEEDEVMHDGGGVTLDAGHADADIADADGDGWEDASDGSSDNDGDPRRTAGTATLLSDHELQLPSGRTAGHRSLKKYFRQNLRDGPYVQPVSRGRRRLLASSSSSTDADRDGDIHMTADNGTLARGRPLEASEQQQALISRANGGLGMLGVSDAKKREVTAVEKRERKRAEREQRKFQWGVEKQANSQKHFRDPLLQ